MKDLENKVEETPMNQIARIIQEDLPEVDQSGAYQCHSNPMNAFRLAMDKAETGTRRKIAKVMFGSMADKPEVYYVFKQFSTEGECKTPVEGSKRYSAELDVAFEPEKVYDNLMKNGNSTEAVYIAVHFGLSNKQIDDAVLLQLQQRKLKAAEPKYGNALRFWYEDHKRFGLLETDFGQSIARLHYESLLRQEMINRKDGLYNSNFFLVAKDVAEESGLGQEYIDRAEALKPTFWQKVKSEYTQIVKGVTIPYNDNGVIFPKVNENGNKI